MSPGAQPLSDRVGAVRGRALGSELGVEARRGRRAARGPDVSARQQYPRYRYRMVHLLLARQSRDERL